MEKKREEELKANAANKGPTKRQKHKMEKMKKKYKDQDDDEREIRLALLGSRGKKVEPVIEQKVLKETKEPPPKERSQKERPKEEKELDEEYEDKEEEVQTSVEDSDGLISLLPLSNRKFQPFSIV